MHDRITLLEYGSHFSFLGWPSTPKATKLGIWESRQGRVWQGHLLSSPPSLLPKALLNDRGRHRPSPEPGSWSDEKMDTA